MVDHPSRKKPPVDAYLLCSICADLVINELANRPVHGVLLYFPRLMLE
jgi:acetamidase/formamidase